MLGTQTAPFAQCAHMTDDFLGLSKVAESECHQRLGFIMQRVPGNISWILWIVACIRLAKSPLKVVGKERTKLECWLDEGWIFMITINLGYWSRRRSVGVKERLIICNNCLQPEVASLLSVRLCVCVISEPQRKSNPTRLATQISVLAMWKPKPNTSCRTVSWVSITVFRKT